VSERRRRPGLRRAIWIVVVLVLGLGWAWKEGLVFSGEEGVEIAGAPVRRGSLEISVTERGNLTAKNSVSIKSEVEGRSTLLYLIEEGVVVEPGELLAEIDTSDMEDRRVAQEIAVQSARAAATKARESLEIQRIENESLIAKAEQQVEFALLELEKFIGADVEGLEGRSFDEVTLALAQLGPTDGDVQVGFTGGNRQQELQQFRDEILIREEELKRAQDRRDWSRQLAEKGFVERTELEADELAYTRSEIMLEQAERALYLLEEYEHPKRWAELQGDLAEARRQLLKANKQAVAQLADFEAAKEASRVKLELEEEKLARLQDQIEKGTIVAPVAGMVVYGRTEGNRWSGGEPIQEGGEVRERQEIVTIPGEGGMIAEASIHESAVEQVSADLPAILRVDALPGREFHGRVTSVAVLPDTNSWWANPNLRLYKTEVVVEEGIADMRPGMSCSIEILIETIADTLYVPVQSVHHSRGRTIAWVEGSSGVEEREVEIGRHNETWLQILTGLEEGEVVLLSPPLGFEPEESAEVVEPGQGGAPGAEGNGEASKQRRGEGDAAESRGGASGRRPEGGSQRGSSRD